MVCLIEEYDPQVYNLLGDVINVSKLVTKEDVFNVGKIIVKYGYQDLLTCTLAHRHFDLDPTEAILEKMEGDVNIAKPYTLDDLKQMDAYPNIIALGKDQLWHPVNYSLGQMDVPAYKDEEFLEELGNFLISNNLQDKLMLSVREKYLKFGKNVRTIELNYAETRTSEVRRVYGDEDLAGKYPHLIQTAYAFNIDENGDIKFGAENNCNHCNHCNHTCVICW